MYRFPAALVALVSSTSLIAQTAAPVPVPAPVKPDAAALNARLNAPLPAGQAAMKAHVMFLASDAMKGREAGSAEYDIAAQYVAAQFYAAGLRPAGDAGGYLQQVPLVAYKAADKGSFVWTARGGEPRTLAFGTDVVPAPDPARVETSVSAPVVFVGDGIDAPQYAHDSYKGVDVQGRIVAFFRGAPGRFAGEERAFFGSTDTKLRIAAAHGAVGAIELAAPSTTADGMTRMADSYDRARTNWAAPAGFANTATPTTPLLGTLSPTAAARMFAGAGTSWASIVAEAARAEPRLKAVPLPGTLTIALHTSFTPMPSSNVVGIVPGSDPVVGKEVVVLSAHLDHIGVGRPVNGDAINNGALDNAIGIASLIEEAKRFTASGKPPRRTVMFLAVTAEEKGLVGADYFAHHPTVPKSAIVADVNLDMPMLLYPFEDMIVFGADRSTLGPIVARAAATAGTTMSPDPNPEQGFFVRSDHFRFVQQGIPSVFLWPGQKGPGKAAVEGFLSTCYHRPCDDLSLPIMWDQGVRFVDVNYRIARDIADGAERPVWNKGDYFGTLYKGAMAR
ncbi:M28 family peptidase [Sphingomonas mollis]|uniref:M28 family peptidase n=1 Tax=Sphingomonas mollis TaxID=2795726 RepID=A0ABS0XRK4_9SPHN|nr:M28 family peptidase [Sphingomonas sp. BT553]MBJ6122680.1 M28 family peptidase [Sphingomonas sp. BT553]